MKMIKNLQPIKTHTQTHEKKSVCVCLVCARYRFVNLSDYEPNWGWMTTDLNSLMDPPHFIELLPQLTRPPNSCSHLWVFYSETNKNSHLRQMRPFYCENIDFQQIFGTNSIWRCTKFIHNIINMSFSEIFFSCSMVVTYTTRWT